MITKHGGAWLKNQIYAQRTTISAFANANGLKHRSLWNWVSQRTPRIRGDHMASLAHGLGISVDELVMNLHPADINAAVA